MSKIESLPGIHWSPEAVFADLDPKDMESVFVIYKLKGEDGWNWHAANLTNGEIYWMLSNHLHQMMEK